MEVNNKPLHNHGIREAIKSIREVIEILGLTEAKMADFEVLASAAEYRLSTKAKFDGAYISCPRCDKQFTPRNPAEFQRGERNCGGCGQRFYWTSKFKEVKG